MELYLVGERFFQGFTLCRVLLNAAKKGRGSLPLAFRAQGPEYCRACRDDDLPCARGDAGADGQRCPCREHALIRRQEHEAWEVLLACQGQLRLARGAT
jgi:hypothetical protein